MDSPDSTDWWDVLDVSVGGGLASSSASSAVDGAAAAALGLNPPTATSGGGGGASMGEGMYHASAEPLSSGLVAPAAVKREGVGLSLSLSASVGGNGAAAALGGKVEAAAPPAGLNEGIGVTASGGRAPEMSWEEEQAESLREVSSRRGGVNVENKVSILAHLFAAALERVVWVKMQAIFFIFCIGVLLCVKTHVVRMLRSRCRASLLCLCLFIICFLVGVRLNSRLRSVATEAPHNHSLSAVRRVVVTVACCLLLFFVRGGVGSLQYCHISTGGAIRRNTGLGAGLVLRAGTVHRTVGSLRPCTVGIVAVPSFVVGAPYLLSSRRPTLSCALASIDLGMVWATRCDSVPPRAGRMWWVFSACI